MRAAAAEMELLSEIMSLKQRLSSLREKARDADLVQLAHESNLRVCRQIPTLALIYQLRAHPSKVHDVVWSPSDRFVLTVGAEGLVIVWDASSGLIHNVLEASAVQPITVAASGDASKIFCGGLCANVVLFNSTHRSEEDGYSFYENCVVFEHSSQVNSIVRVGESQLLTGSAKDGAILWDVESGNVLARFTHATKLECVSLIGTSTEMGSCVTGANDGVIRQWDPRHPRNPVAQYEAHQSNVNCIRTLPNEINFVTGSDDAAIHLYDIRTDVVVSRYLDRRSLTKSPLMESESDAALSHLGSRIAEAVGICDIAVSPSGRLIIAGSQDCGVYYWDLIQPTVCLCHETEPGPVVRVAMSYHKKALVMLTWEAKARIRIMRPH
ncbi:unnamed protein product [Dicrocoelium dendriticum]|nr:unnamed protein product [Dicrocoelium dendriticum]